MLARAAAQVSPGDELPALEAELRRLHAAIDERCSAANEMESLLAQLAFKGVRPWTRLALGAGFVLGVALWAGALAFFSFIKELAHGFVP